MTISTERPLRAGVVGLGMMGRNHVGSGTRSSRRRAGRRRRSRSTRPRAGHRRASRPRLRGRGADAGGGGSTSSASSRRPASTSGDARGAARRRERARREADRGDARGGPGDDRGRRAAGRMLTVGHIERFNRRSATSSAARAGELGRIFQISATRLGPFPAGSATSGSSSTSPRTTSTSCVRRRFRAGADLRGGRAPHPHRARGSRAWSASRTACSGC